MSFWSSKKFLGSSFQETSRCGGTALACGSGESNVNAGKGFSTGGMLNLNADKGLGRGGRLKEKAAEYVKGWYAGPDNKFCASSALGAKAQRLAPSNRKGKKERLGARIAPFIPWNLGTSNRFQSSEMLMQRRG